MLKIALKGMVAFLVKGVNKKVIEINDTGNEVFEKVVLYIKPQYSVLSNKDLKREAKVILKNYSMEEFDYEGEGRGSKRLLFALFCAVIVAVTVTALCLIF